MKYNPNEIEAKWQKYWLENKTFAAFNQSEKPKYYVLDMFPYPSGAGLHVGHPLGYIASDIYARFKRHKGFNVLHPQGYDSFGLPAEQYAIQTGQHPNKTTKENIARYRQQLDKIGFSFDWDREVRTSNADYYKWTQWIFIQLFESWYCQARGKAHSIADLIKVFAEQGNAAVEAVCDDHVSIFTAFEWNNYGIEQQQKILLQYRLTYLAESEVNWCPGLGTVLANDEIVNGVSERGGFQVVRKKMTQWSMRISAYADRLLRGLDTIDWTESLKESQRNWIGKSVGAIINFHILPHPQPLSKGMGSEKSYRHNEFGYKTANPKIAKKLVEYARENRKNQTESEEILWQEIRNSYLGFKIRRQHYIDNFIADFVSLEKNLIIEVDGEIHDYQKEYDEGRTYELEQYGFKIIRFTNEEIKNDLEAVLNKIKNELNTRQSITEVAKAPLSFGEGLGVRLISIFSTRPDTIFGVTFLTLAPEHDLVSKITTVAQKQAVDKYVDATTKRSERERMADVKTISGVFTGAYAEHPFTKEPIPIWIGDYVLAGYGTGAVMAVPCGDERDYAFAKHFDIPIKNIFNQDISKEAYVTKDKFLLENSDFLDGLNYKQASKTIIEELEKIEQGKGKTNYRLRDAVFSRQRYWGEPFPIYYVNGLPQTIDIKHLPIKLPDVEKYLPTEDGQPPLGNAITWAWDSVKNTVVDNELIDNETIFSLELNTMPGWAGSSWYWLRYMDAKNENEFVSEKAENYWQNVDLYIGGSEHATGHLLYARFWNKFLKDRGFISQDEPFKKLINQGMILGMSAFIYLLKVNYDMPNEKIQLGLNFAIPKYLYDDINNSNFENIDYSLFENHFQQKKYGKGTLDIKSINKENIRFNHVSVDIVNISNELNVDEAKKRAGDIEIAEFIYDKNGKYIVGREVEKMSKSKYNVVSPDNICEEYGADTLRLYEMFLGPLEQSKPWNTAGITGVFGFLKKLWKLYFNEQGLVVTSNLASKEALKSLHKTIKKTTEDIEGFSFNTSVSQFMICVNELTAMNCHERSILEPLTILISPYAPHIAEELWEKLGHQTSISEVAFPIFNPDYLIESSKEYPVSFNGKMRFTIKLPLDLTVAQIQEIIMEDERTIKQLEGKTPNKFIIVPGKIINLVGQF